MYILAYNDCYDNDYISIFIGSEQEIVEKVEELISTDTFVQPLNNIDDVLAYLDYKFIGNKNAAYVTLSDINGNILVQA